MGDQLSHDEFVDQSLLPAYIDKDDLDQEVALLRLRGVERPNRKLILLHLISQSPDLHFSQDVTYTNPDAINPFAAPEVSESSIQELMSLARAFPELSDSIYTFLDEPSDDNFNFCLKQAKRLGIVEEKSRAPVNRPSSMTDMVLALLVSKGCLDRETIIATLAPAHMSKRPAATVRTALRRLVSTGAVVKIASLYAAATTVFQDEDD